MKRETESHIALCLFIASVITILMLGYGMTQTTLEIAVLRAQQQTGEEEP